MRRARARSPRGLHRGAARGQGGVGSTEQSPPGMCKPCDRGALPTPAGAGVPPGASLLASREQTCLHARADQARLTLGTPALEQPLPSHPHPWERSSSERGALQGWAGAGGFSAS